MEFYFVMCMLDYKYSLWGLPEGSPERERVKHDVHMRGARRLQELCFRNGGVYIKLGQHVSQLVCHFDESLFGDYESVGTFFYFIPNFKRNCHLVIFFLHYVLSSGPNYFPYLGVLST